MPNINKANKLANEHFELSGSESEKLAHEIYSDQWMTLPRLLKLKNDYEPAKNCKTRAELCNVLARLLSNKELFNIYFENLNPEKQNFLVKVIKTACFSVIDAYYCINLPFPRKNLQQKEKSRYSYYYGPQRISEPDFELEAFPYFFSCDNRFILINPTIKEKLSDLLKEKELITDPRVKEQEEKLSARITEEQGLEIVKVIKPLINTLNSTGFFSYEQTKAELKRQRDSVSKICPWSDFGVDKKISNRLNMCTVFIKSVFNQNNYPSFTVPVDLKLSSAEIVRKIFELYTTTRDITFDDIFLFNEGMSEGRYSADFYDERTKSLKLFFEFFKNWPFKDEVEFEYLMNNFEKLNLPYPFNYSKNYYGYKYYSYDYHYTTRDTCKDNDGSFFYGNTLPAWGNLLILFSYFGLFELTRKIKISAFSEENNNNQNYTEAYFRNFSARFPNGIPLKIKMTEFGKYVFGISDSYEIEEPKVIAAPVLADNDYLLILDKNDTVTAQVLKSTTKKLADTILMLDKEKVFKNCKTINELQNYFTDLSKLSKKQLPPLWNLLYAQLMQRYIYLPYDDDYIVFSLDKMSKEVMEAINQISKEIEGVYRMEGKKVAVRKDFIREFEKKLQEKGFRMPKVDLYKW